MEFGGDRRLHTANLWDERRISGFFPQFPDRDLVRNIQGRVREIVDISTPVDADCVRCVAGADAAYTGTHIFAGVVVMSFPSLALLERVCEVQPVTFPYIPGLLAFREGPAIASAFGKLSRQADVIFINGHGYSHPTRAGLASHVGVALDIPAIGIAKSSLVGTAVEPERREGSQVPLTEAGEVIGMAVRTRSGSKPIYVSAGYRIDLATAVSLTLAAIRHGRFPEPLRCADLLAKMCLRNTTTSSCPQKKP